MNLGASRCCDLPGLGPIGSQGQRGNMGTIGVIGFDGSTGSTGITGATGFDGSIGEIGTAGRDSSFGNFNSTLASYTLGNPISIQCTSTAPITLFKTYALHVSFFLFSRTGIPYSDIGSEQQYHASCNVQPNIGINEFIYPVLYSNPSTRSTTQTPDAPYYCTLNKTTLTIRGVTAEFVVITGSFSTYFTYNNTDITADNPFYINFYLGNNGTSATTPIAMITDITVTINPLTSY